jgi:hypothetical protein
LIKIAIFSNDAGSSEILIALYKKFKKDYKFKLFYLSSSPFENLIKTLSDKVKIENNKTNIYKKLDDFKPNLILYGTSWQVDTAEIFLEYSKKIKIKSIAFLDHWVSYKERFSSLIPDFIATFDDKSTKIAKKLNLSNIIQIKNYYFENLKNRYKSLHITERNQILFLSEPTSKVALARFNDGRYWEFDETDIYLEIINFAKSLNLPLITRIHPSDTKKTYLKLNEKAKFSKNDLLEDIATSKIIIGIDTVALYNAYTFGKKVIALMPTSKRSVSIPLPIENITKTLTTINLSSIKLQNADVKENSIEFKDFIQKEFL